MKLELFSDGHFQQFADRCRQGMRTFIERIPDEELLNAIDTELIQELYRNHNCQEITVDFEGMEVLRQSEKQIGIPAHELPDPFAGSDLTPRVPGYHVIKQVIALQIGYTGSGELMKFIPSPGIPFHPTVELLEGRIIYELINFENSAEYLARILQEFKDKMAIQLKHLNNQIKAYSNTLELQILQKVEERKKEILKRKQMVESLGIPLAKNKDVPKSLNIPIKRETIVVLPPKNTKPDYVPDPEIDMGVYQSILALIHDWGKVMERHPDTYIDKGEDALRNLFILLLTPHFKMDGSTTGETFNHIGKTDILIRYQNTNAFVAECKIWNGEKLLMDTITQALGYLTWRDSKAAVIMFVKRKGITKIEEKIVEQAQKHPCFLSYVDKKADGFYNFVFRLKEGVEKKVYLAVLLFHFNESDEGKDNLSQATS